MFPGVSKVLTRTVGIKTIWLDKCNKDPNTVAESPKWPLFSALLTEAERVENRDFAGPTFDDLILAQRYPNRTHRLSVATGVFARREEVTVGGVGVSQDPYPRGQRNTNTILSVQSLRVVCVDIVRAGTRPR